MAPRVESPEEISNLLSKLIHNLTPTKTKEDTSFYYNLCNYCQKVVNNGIVRNRRIYCNKRHAFLGCLIGEK